MQLSGTSSSLDLARTPPSVVGPDEDDIPEPIGAVGVDGADSGCGLGFGFGLGFGDAAEGEEGREG